MRNTRCALLKPPALTSTSVMLRRSEREAGWRLFRGRSGLAADQPLLVAWLAIERLQLGFPIRAAGLAATVDEALGWHLGGKVWGFNAIFR